MFSLWDDFTLGLAGVGDLIGITDGAAAREWAEQEGEAKGLELDDVEELATWAEGYQREADVIREAAGKTGDKLAAPVKAFGSWLLWTLWGAAALVVAGLGFYALRVYGPKPKRKVLA